MKKTAVKWTVVGILALVMVGCVSQRRADDLETLYRRSQEQVVDLRAQLEECRARVRALQSAQNTQDPQLLAKLEQAVAERDRLAKALADAEKSLRDASKGPIALPEDLNQALVGLAQSNPNLIEYDARLGMLRFRSDLTFALGSTDVSASAQASLDKLAQILKSSSASEYEARIVGHTDNVPVSRPQTKAKHPDNWYLSVHRAIAVMEVLRKAGVPPVRIEVAGHGEFRPIVPNAGNRGAEANRRVEIYLVPSTYRGPTASAQSTTPSATSSATPTVKEAPAPAAPAATEAPEQFK